MHILRDELPNIEVSVSSRYSPELASALMRGKLELKVMQTRLGSSPGLETLARAESKRGAAHALHPACKG